MAAFFGLQSMQAYAIFGWFATLWRDAGSPHGRRRPGRPGRRHLDPALRVGATAGRTAGQPALVLFTVMALYPVGYLGLVVAPHPLAVLSAIVLGTSTTKLPMVRAVGLRATKPEGTAALSSFTRSTGCLLAALGPFGVGILHEASDGSTGPLVVLAGLTRADARAGRLSAQGSSSWRTSCRRPLCAGMSNDHLPTATRCPALNRRPTRRPQHR